MTLSPITDHSIPAAALAAVLMACTVSPGCAPRPEAPQQATVAAASDLQFALEDILGDFRRAHPSADIRVVYGSSGNFYTQIRGQAPFDLFLSADVEYPRRLAREGLALPESLFTYAVGRIVVWAPAGSPLDLARLGMGALEAPSVRHVAIANPEHAPYGRAAAAAMKSMGVYDRVAGKLVLGENVAQALEFVQSGAAEVGIVPLSLAVAPPVRSQGRYWEVPLDAYPAIEQGGAILTRARHSRLALDLRNYIAGPAARDRLKQYGFFPPPQERH
jgi:molybdate transport system substrate-binding protein